jgi:hypothetical protein
MSSYIFAISLFTNGLDVPQLQQEIATQFQTVLYINTNSTDIEIFFSASLSEPEQSTLGGICAAHMPIMPPSAMIDSSDPNFAVSSNISNVLNMPTSSDNQDTGYLIQRYQQENDEGTGTVVSDTPALTGTAQSGSSTTIRLASGTSSTTDYYKNWWIKITAGTGINQVRKILVYNGTTKDATTSNWTTSPNNTSVYALYFRHTTGLIYDDTSLLWKLVYHPAPPVSQLSPSTKLLLNDYANLQVADVLVNGQSANTHLNHANIHADHSAISINTAPGLTGGGTIAATRTIGLDINALTAHTSLILADSLLVYDSVALDHKKITISNLNKIVFPPEFEQAASEGINSTTSTTDVVKLTFTTATKPIGTYKWEWSCDITGQSTSGRATATVFIDGVEVDSTIFTTRVAATSTAFLATYNSNKFNGFINITYASASTHIIEIRYKTSVNTSYCGVRRARITIERVA